MRDPEIVRLEMQQRNENILNAAFELFLNNRIEGTSMEDIAKAAKVGRVTLYRYYSSKGEIAIALWNREWHKLLDELDITRPIADVEKLPAIDRLTFAMDIHIATYTKHKEIFKLNENINHYLAHQKDVDVNEYTSFKEAMISADTRYKLMYEKAKEDKTIRTDMPLEELLRVTVNTMYNSCVYYADEFLWGAKENMDYTPELLRLKEMILDYATKGI